MYLDGKINFIIMETLQKGIVMYESWHYIIEVVIKNITIDQLFIHNPT